jgi:hypothetical protein
LINDARSTCVTDAQAPLQQRGGGTVVLLNHCGRFIKEAVAVTSFRA